MTHSELRETVRYRVGNGVMHQVRGPVQILGGDQIDPKSWAQGYENVRLPIDSTVGWNVRWNVRWQIIHYIHI